jgi:hypothetical protein
MKRNPVLKSIIVSVALSAVFAGCGSSSSSSSSTEDKSTQISGYAVDGYLKFATVCLDINKDGYCQDIEPMTSTKENGSFTLDIKPEVQKKDGYDEAMLLVYGGVDVDTGDDFKGKLLAPADSKEISVTPLTTIVAKMVQEDLKESDKPSKEVIKQKIEEAKAKVAKALGIDIEDLTKDPVAQIKTNSKLIKEALKIQKSIEAYNDENSDDMEELYEKLAKHIKESNLNGEKGADMILKNALNLKDDDKAVKVAEGIDKAFDDFDGDLQKVSFVTKKLQKNRKVQWEKLKGYDDKEWSDEFIKSDLEDIGIDDISDEDIQKVKDLLGDNVKVKPGIVKEFKEKFKDSDDGFEKEIYHKFKDFDSKKEKKRDYSKKFKGEVEIANNL